MIVTGDEAPAEPTPEVRDHPEEQRFELRVHGELAGIAVYEPRGDAYAIMHTEVDEHFAGRGLASVLTRSALDELRSRGAAVLPYCPYVRRFLARHREYVDLVPVGQRARFGLEDADG